MLKQLKNKEPTLPKKLPPKIEKKKPNKGKKITNKYIIYPFKVSIKYTKIVPFNLSSATKSANPTAASEAATVKIINAKIWPKISSRYIDNPINNKSKDNNISSRHINVIKIFFFIDKIPKTLISHNKIQIKK